MVRKASDTKRKNKRERTEMCKMRIGCNRQNVERPKMERIRGNECVVRGSSWAVPAAVFKTDQWALDRSGGLNSTPVPSHAGGTRRASGRSRVLGSTATAGRGVRGMHETRQGGSRRLREAGR